jgi:hypothetical protein
VGGERGRGNAAWRETNVDMVSGWHTLNFAKRFILGTLVHIKIYKIKK